jgi:hypothetical protein
MKRRLFNLAVLLSLILCLGCLFMWVRSAYVVDNITLTNDGLHGWRIS